MNFDIGCIWEPINPRTTNESLINTAETDPYQCLNPIQLAVHPVEGMLCF